MQLAYSNSHPIYEKSTKSPAPPQNASIHLENVTWIGFGDTFICFKALRPCDLVEILELSRHGLNQEQSVHYSPIYKVCLLFSPWSVIPLIIYNYYSGNNSLSSPILIKKKNDNGN